MAPLPAAATVRGNGAGRSIRAPAAVPALVTLLVAALALRLIIAYVLFPGSGFESDLSSFTSWALNLAAGGPGDFYATAGFADYPPGYLYVLWLVGLVSQALAPLAGGDAAALAGGLIKVPPMLADLGVGYLLYRFLLGRARARVALGGAALYLFNPVTVYDSALWGQTDAAGALVMLLALGALLRGQSEAAIGFAVLAGLVKPQFGVVIAPLVVIVLLRRHLFRAGTGPRPARVPKALHGWLVEEQGPWRLVSALTVGLLTLMVFITPFSLDIPGFIDQMSRTAGGYPWLSVNAYNPWALVGSGGQPPLAANGGWSDDQVPLLGPMPGVLIGTLLLAAGFLLALVRAGARDDRRSLILVATVLALAFFVLPTRVHERYLFPAFAFLPLLAARDRRWLVATLLLIVASLINLHGVLTNPLYGTPNVDDLPLGALFRSYWPVALSVVLHTGVFLFAFWSLWRDRSVPDELPEEASPSPAPAPRRAPPAAAALGTGSALVTRSTPSDLGDRERAPEAGPPEGLPAWEEEVTFTGVRAAQEHRPTPLPGEEGRRPWRPRLPRVGPPPIRSDRSGLLAGEPVGRLDRLDLLFLVGLVLAALFLRTWRLEEPRDMHFDEVYHARTGTEFLQQWRYGMTHDIYEYTHPHLAKYAMALGIIAFAGDQVSGRAELGVVVEDALLETRWSPDDDPERRNGDRLYVLTGSELRAYDLEDRALAATVPSDAVRAAVDETTHRLLLADADGRVTSLETSTFDDVRQTPGSAPASLPAEVGGLAGPVEQLAIMAEGATLVGLGPDGSVSALDLETAALVGPVSVPGAAAAVDVPASTRIVADPTLVGDPADSAARLAEALDQDAADVQARLEGGDERVVVASYVSDEQRDAVQAAVDAGDLAGITVESAPGLAVVGQDAVQILDTLTLEVAETIQFSGRGQGAVLVKGLDDPTLYVAVDRRLETVRFPDGEPPVKGGVVSMPGVVTDVAWNEPTNLVHALGERPADRGPGATVYTIEPHANAVFADTELPATPRAWLLDLQPQRPSADRGQLLAIDEAGAVASADVGHYQFAWRLPGVIAGALTTGLLYLLGRLLFRRRGVALVAAFLTLIDGMFFANARIAMNDTYVSLFILAAFTLFAALYLGHWRGWIAVLLGLPAVGVLLGLALSSKWVGAYAIGGILLLVLIRSALGRLIALTGMVGITSLLGYLAVLGPPDVAAPNRNIGFLLLMLALTLAMAVLFVLRPVRFTIQELRFAVLAPGVLGVLVALGGIVFGAQLPAAISSTSLVLGGLLLLVLGNVVYISAWLAGRQGLGPLASRIAPGDPAALADPPGPAPSGWLRPGAAGGISWTWAIGCLAVIPILVYIASYIPWVAMGNQWVEGVPAGFAGHQTFPDLQRQMYEYHNNLRAAHAASSPWWAWPLDLKPVWFYQDTFANGTTGLIYDAGNIVLFWLALPVMGWISWQAWRRRSLALTVVVLGAASLWLPWVRIDRATFQYHVFTSLPFAFLGLAYFLGELWHGPSRRTWLFTRVVAALALLGVPLLWLLRRPLCGLAGTERVSEGSQACVNAPAQLLTLEGTAVSTLIVLVGVLLLVWQLRQHRRPGGRWSLPSVGTAAGAWGLAGMAATIVGTVALLALATASGQSGADSEILGDRGIYVLAGALLVIAPPLLALYALMARDSRRFAVGILAAAAFWFVLFYPNISGLPLPNGIAHMYLGLLPTYNYDFQFAVNLDEAFDASLFDLFSLSLLAVVALLVIFTMYATYMWRLWTAARRASGEFPPPDQPAPGATAASRQLGTEAA